MHKQILLFLRFFAVAAISLAAIPALGGQAKTSARKPATTKSTAPRTPWGDVDLQGIYTSDDFKGVPLERPVAFGERQFLTDEEYARRVEEVQKETEADLDPTTPLPAGGLRGPDEGQNRLSYWFERGKPQRQTSLIIDPPNGRIPFVSEEARQRALVAQTPASARGTGFTGPEDFGLWERCITKGLPRAILPGAEGSTFQLIQAPGYVAIIYEMIHETRIIPLDRQFQLPPYIHQYFGNSGGHWEGDTLVVETTNFTDRTKYQGSGPDMRLTERFAWIGPGTLSYEFTVNDSATFTRPWTARFNLTATSRLEEYACHEGNYAMTNMLSGARADEKR